jgi:hypothetical protein
MKRKVTEVWDKPDEAFGKTARAHLIQLEACALAHF